MKGYLADLWRYQMSTNMWTWISGTDSTPFYGKYGTKGVPDYLNMPGGRYGAAGWFDSLREEFWLFGGTGLGASDSGM